MRKALLVLGVLVALAVAGLALFAVLYKPAQRPAPRERTAVTPARLDRGRYLVESVLDCNGCHTQRDWRRYGGPEVGPRGAGGLCLGREHGFPGRLCGSNITPDVATGLGGWTDGEILRALREGVDREGRALFPLMPYQDYRALSDEDAGAVVAYLRTLPPVRHEVPERKLDFPVSFFVKMSPKPLKSPVPAVDPTDRLRYGEYLATVAGCRFCHTPVDEKQQPVPGRAFAGGHELIGPWGTVRTSNLTPHPTGLGMRSQDNFAGMMRSWAQPEARHVAAEPGRNTAMPWFTYAGMKDEDLEAIYDYLRTVPAVENRVEIFPPRSAGGGER
jgi:mono/diheme cytochrome c family protein